MTFWVSLLCMLTSGTHKSSMIASHIESILSHAIYRNAPQRSHEPGQPMTAPRLQGLDNEAAQHVVATARALDMRRPDQAAAQLRPALASHPDHPEVLRLHAGILSLRGDHVRAIAAMQRAVKLRPQDPLYFNTLGSVLGSSGDFDGAI